MKPKTLFIASLMALSGSAVTGCATLFSDVAVTDAIKQGKIYVGMSLDQLIAIVGHRPNQFQDRFQVRNDASGETLEWIPSAKEGTLWNSYMFTFKNRRLVSWQGK